MSGTTPSAKQPEFLELGGRSPKHPRRGLILGIVAGVLLALGLPIGAFAVLRFLGGGTQPQDVLPANAVGFFRIDLDPSAPEKIDALRFLRTFPAFEKYTRITDERADVRKEIFEAATAGTPCRTMDFKDDVAPWLGERLGVALMAPTAGDREPGVVTAVQVTDEHGARQGLSRLATCETQGAPQAGWTYRDGYMIVSDTRQQAQTYADAAATRSLAEDAQFVSDMHRLGDQGVASAWFSGEGLYQAFSSSVIGDPGPAGAEFDLMRDRVRRQIEQSYSSGAFAFRFDSRYAEVASVLTGSAYREPQDRGVADMALPETTAVAFGFADGAQYIDQQWDMLLDLAGGDPVGLGAGADRTARQTERELGLQLPADLQTLVGDRFTLALDGADLDLGALMRSADPSQLDLGVRVRTDGAGFSRIVHRLEARAARHGVPLDLVMQQTDDGAIAALNDDYAADLAQSGSLTDTDVFRTAVPDATDAQSVFFLNFDTLEGAVLRQMPLVPPQVTGNLTKVQALGVSGSIHDGYSQGLLRVTVAD